MITNNIAGYKLNTKKENKSSLPNSTVVKTLSTYNPSFYRPVISFKSNDYDYIPSDILGVSEEEFDKQLNQAIQSPEKRAEIAKLILSEISKDTKTIELINLWMQQVGPIDSEEAETNNNTGNNVELVKQVGKLIGDNYSRSALRKFLESDSQTEEITKNTENSGTEMLSSKLFEMGIVESDPTSKKYLLAASIITERSDWAQKSEDAKKAQSKQFVDTTREFLKMGIVDPYNVIKIIFPDKDKLSETRQMRYNRWSENKLASVKYQKSNTHKTQSSDLKTEEGKALLKKSIEVLRSSGFDSDKLSQYLGILGLIYLSTKEAVGSQLLLESALDIQKKSYGQDSIKTLPNLDALARAQAENEEYLNARETYKKSLAIRQQNNANPIEIFNKERELYTLDKHLQTILLGKIDFIGFDEQSSVTISRKKKLADEKDKIQAIKPQLTYEINDLEEKLVEFANSDLFNTLPLGQRVSLLTELTRSFSSKLMPISRLLNPIKQTGQESAKANYLLPIELFAAANDSTNLIETLQGKYGSGSRLELSALEQQGKTASDIDKLRKAFTLSQEINGNDNPDSCRLAFEIANMSRGREDITNAIKLIGEGKSGEAKNSYLCRLNILLMEDYMKESVSVSKLYQADAAVKRIREHYNQAVLLAPDYKTLHKAIASMMKFIDEHHLIEGEYEKIDKGGEYNNFVEEQYTAIGNTTTFDKQRILEETIQLLDKNPGKYNIHKRSVLQLLSKNLNGTFFVNSKRRKISDQIAQLEQKAGTDEIK